MLWSREDVENRARSYAATRGVELVDALGRGAQGIVFATDQSSAIKVHGLENSYRRERDVYLRLHDNSVFEIRRFAVPLLDDWDDCLLALEISIVKPPFLLDFAGAYLDFPPEFSQETMAEWRAEKREQFGARWHEVELVLRALEEYGIYYQDPNPGNIRFGPEGDDLLETELERDQ
jgi:hypothetical protein